MSEPKSEKNVYETRRIAENAIYAAISAQLKQAQMEGVESSRAVSQMTFDLMGEGWNLGTKERERLDRAISYAAYQILQAMFRTGVNLGQMAQWGGGSWDGYSWDSYSEAKAEYDEMMAESETESE